jgi:NADPH:quinone reductase-like Zn-dependent oxidoreductase
MLVRVEYSSINYKDALAATGRGRILRKFPLIGGIDLAGEVLESSDDRFRPGDKVLAIGGGQSETRNGGYTELACVSADNAVLIPENLNTRIVMALGTPGSRQPWRSTAWRRMANVPSTDRFSSPARLVVSAASRLIY